MDETLIPLLPCVSLDEVLDFYQTLGFEVTYQQKEPYLYGAVRRGGIELHFSPLTAYGAKNAFGACLVFVTKVEPYHRTFADALREKYGKVPPQACHGSRGSESGRPASTSSILPGMCYFTSARHETADPIERARVLAARAELAVAMGDAERAQAVRLELQQILLSDEDRDRFRDELQAADDLERWLIREGGEV